MDVLKLYSIAETAKILGVSTRTVYRLMEPKSGKNQLKAAKIGNVWRVSETDLRQFIDNGRKNPQDGKA